MAKIAPLARAKRSFSVRVFVIFSGIELEKTRISIVRHTRPEKNPIYKIYDPTRPGPVRAGFGPGSRSGRVPESPP